jgi:molybdenum cofactor guanylyltransferase
MGGGDKTLKSVGGRSILDRVIDRARGQVGFLILNANGDPARFSAYGLPVIPDVLEGHAGPLAGVLTGMEWAAANAPEVEWVASFATDAPFLPPDLVARLWAAAIEAQADMACASSGGQAHPVFGLWPVRLRHDLRRAMVEEEIRKVDRWTARYRLAIAEFPAVPADPFFNANKPGDLADAEALIAAGAVP